MRTPSSTLMTPRLSLRRFVRTDVDWFNRLNADAAVMRYLGGPMSRAESEAMFEERVVAYYDQHPGLGLWVTQERDGGAIIGFHLLNHIRGEPHIQVGYRLFEAFWGRGYATEMTIALLHYGFVDLGLPRIVATTHLDNRESQHVLQKAGLRRDGQRRLRHAAYGPDSLAWFTRDATDWRAERG
jgi:ribosomal-protein-alanine N-acetyltransferase